MKLKKIFHNTLAAGLATVIGVTSSLYPLNQNPLMNGYKLYQEVLDYESLPFFLYNGFTIPDPFEIMFGIPPVHRISEEEKWENQPEMELFSGGPLPEDGPVFESIDNCVGPVFESIGNGIDRAKSFVWRHNEFLHIVNGELKTKPLGNPSYKRKYSLKH